MLGVGGFFVAINNISLPSPTQVSPIKLRPPLSPSTAQAVEQSTPELTPALPKDDTIVSEATQESEPILEPEPAAKPLNIRLDYIGVENTQGGNVQLVVVVSDGDKIEKYSIPRNDEYYTMHDFDVKKISKRVFHTTALKGDLKLNIVAYHRDQSAKINLELLDMMEWYYGDSINMLKNLLLNMPDSDKLIGGYERTWYSDESIAAGQYYESDSDLHIWFSMWSDTEPATISEPVLLPDVRIQSVSLPTDAKKRGEYEIWIIRTYYTTLRLINNESTDITVAWQGHSSVTGNFDSGSATVPKRSYKDIKKDYYYDTAGAQTITYRIYFRSTELDSWSSILNVAP